MARRRRERRRSAADHSAAGGTILSHVNDAGFWIVKEYMGMTVPDTLRTWSIMKVVLSVVGFGFILLAQALFF